MAIATISLGEFANSLFFRPLQSGRLEEGIGNTSELVMDDWYDDFDLSVEDVAFLLGVFAARGISSPTEGEFESALDLLYCHLATLETEQ
jgi:hypothetical protein